MDNNKLGNKRNGSPPPVSVIIPVYNGEHYLAEAIESVLNQSFQAFELLVIDDGSTDKSGEIACSYPRVRYIHQNNRGVASARNRGIHNSQGTFLTFLDADDIWLPEKLALQIKAFDHDTSLEIVTGYVEQFVSPEIDDQIAKKYSFSSRPLAGYSTSAMIIKKTVLNKTGLFHEDLHEGETISWFANIFEKDLKIIILPQVVTKRRIHGGNLSLLDQPNKNKILIQILKKSIDRKRASSTNPEET